MAIYQCPGCGKIRFNGRWVKPESIDSENLKGEEFIEYACRPCRDDPETRKELLNEGVLLQTPR